MAEAHGDAETLLKLCAVEMATCVLGELSKKNLATLQLSKIIVKRRIQDISADIERQLSRFSLRLDYNFSATCCMSYQSNHLPFNPSGML
jgi:hypothetical protein